MSLEFSKAWQIFTKYLGFRPFISTWKSSGKVQTQGKTLGDLDTHQIQIMEEFHAIRSDIEFGVISDDFSWPRLQQPLCYFVLRWISICSAASPQEDRVSEVRWSWPS